MISNAMLMDCMDYMATVPDKWFDLAVVDPPYGINAHTLQPPSDSYRARNGRNPSKRLNGGSGKLKDRILNNSNCEWDKEVPTEEYFTELFRISKNQIIWGGNYFNLPPTRCMVCWDKIQPWENFSQIELAWTSFDKPAKIYSEASMRTGETKIHPTQKSVKLYSWVYGKFLPQGGKVFDSHLGSGSNRIAADKSANIDFYATEIDADYFNAQEKRWRDYKTQAVIAFPERIEPEQTALF